MATYRQPPPLRGASTAAGNGKPGAKPYVYQGGGDSQREEEVQAFLDSARARIAARQDTTRAFRAEMPGDAFAVIPQDHDWPDGDDHAAARARVVVVPCSPNGRRRPWRGPMPPSLAARLAAAKQPPIPAGPPARCRRCGYVRTRCSCKGQRK